MTTLTEAQARKLGYQIIRGSYIGTSDNRLDRWYLDRIDSDVLDRRGDGFTTKREALEALSLNLEFADQGATR